jgi:hypothetical protein
VSNRREFIKQVLISGAPFALAGACRSSRHTGRTDAAAIGKLRNSLQGQLILPGDGAYDDAKRLFFRNPTIEKSPRMIARCKLPDDIARCVEFGRRHDLLLAVRAGGHSFAGWSTCEDGLVIDVSPMKGIAVDPVNQTAQAGSGVLAHELVEATRPHGLAPVLGECPTVGISGLTLGGGLGWLSGKYGAACDNLLSAELMTANSEAIVANAAENPDLFWAIRGGGGNFGIVTSLTYRLHPVSEVFAGVLGYRPSDARNMLNFYRDFMADAPDEFQADAELVRGPELGLNLQVCFSGDLDAGEKVIRALRTRASPVHDTVQPRAYSDSFIDFGEGPRFSQIKACYLESLSEDAIDLMLDRLAQAPDDGASIGFGHYMHGAVCRVPSDATAFELRRAGAAHVRILAMWGDPSVTASIVEWSEETLEACRSYSAGRIYANYPNTEGPAAARSAYGANYSRLLEIKNKYDQSNVFRLNQNIAPSASA